ncbi:MAG: GGDEF domain-containing protein [Oscillospiraceae bacterium]|nr:GGDEF domain-containing protein [Oscillospiraceae bacterium]
MNLKGNQAGRDTADGQGGIVGDIQGMMAGLLQDTIQNMQKAESGKALGEDPGEGADDAAPQMSVDDMKQVVGTMQRFLDGIRAMIAQLEGGEEYMPGEDGFMDDYLSTADNILEIAAFNMKDGVTGLSNRSGFDGRLVIEWNRAAREKTPLSLILIGLREAGAAGDGHLRDSYTLAITEALKNTIKRSTDFVAHWSVDEFAILLPITNAEGAAIVAERIRADIDRIGSESAVGGPGRIEAYIGVNVAVPAKDEKPKKYLDDVYEALNEARKEGSGNTAFHKGG